MVPQTDKSILHEIVRIVESRGKVPDRVRVRGGEFQITYLDDHKRRLEETLHRRDPDRLNMLYGQMASKVKYQLLRRIPSGSNRVSIPHLRAEKRAGSGKAPRGAGSPAAKRTTGAGKVRQSGAKRAVGSNKSLARKKPGIAAKPAKRKTSRLSRAARN